MTGPTVERVSRAPSDVLRLGVATTTLAVVVLLGWRFDRAVVDHVAGWMSGLRSLPPGVIAVVATCGQVLGLVVLGGGLVVATWRREWRLLAAAGSAAVLAAVVTAVLDEVVDAASAVTRVDESLTVVSAGGMATAAGLAAVTAVVTAAAPWVSRRWRRAAWTLVVLLAAVRAFTAPVSLDTLVAVLAGWCAGAAAVVAFGAPSRRPTAAAIAGGLGAVGVPLEGIEPLAVDARGSTPYLATAVDGSALFVKALGDDERSADLMFRLYRWLQPWSLGDERAFSSLRRMVEHEALVALAAGATGIRTPALVAFATAEPNGFVLAYEAVAGRSLDRVEADEITDGVLDAIWAQVVVLRTHRIAHRDLRSANLFLGDDGGVWIIDFGFAELAADDRLLATDVAELLASSTTRVGADRAVRAGVAAVGAEVVVGALERLQLPLLSHATRQATKAAGSLGDLRHVVEARSAGAITHRG